MKKFFVATLVIISFVGYSIYQRNSPTPSISLAVPQASVNPTPAPTQNTPTDTPPQVPIQTPTPTPTQQTQAATPIAPPPPTPQDTPTPTPKSNSPYKDGSFTGDAANAFYGYIQVSATIANGKITNVQFLQYPSDRSRSVEINQQADPMLAQEAIQAQSAQVNIISGATDSSQAFAQSLQSALDKAKS